MSGRHSAGGGRPPRGARAHLPAPHAPDTRGHEHRRPRRPLPDHRLERLPDARLVAYIHEMRTTNHTHAARRAQQIFAWRYRDRLAAYVGNRAHQSEVDDTVARVLLAAGKSTFRRRTVPECLAWLFAIAHNQVVNIYRGRGRRPVTVTLESDVHTDLRKALAVDDGWTDAAHVRLELERILSGLRTDHELAVRLGLVDADLPAGDVARVLSMSESNVYQTICRFRKQLRGRLRED